MLTISPAGVALVKHHEGLRLQAYLCPAGIPTIGYGHTGPALTRADVAAGKRIAPAEAERLLAEDLGRTAGEVAAELAHPPGQHQLDAMASLAFNIGPHAFAQSAVLKLFNAGDLLGAAVAFERWDKAHVNGELVALPGLLRRRRDEAALFLAPDGAPPPPFLPAAPRNGAAA